MTIEIEAAEEARERLAAAIRDYCQAVGLLDKDTALLNHWAVVASVTKVEDDGWTTYPLIFHQFNTPAHVANGLFRQALHILEHHPQCDADD